MPVKVPHKLYHAVQKLGLLEPFTAMIQAQSYEQAQAALRRLQSLAKRSFKTLARQHHPDVGGSLEAMQALSAAYEVVKRIQLQRPVPRQTVVVRMTGWGTCYYNTSTDTSTTGTGYW